MIVVKEHLGAFFMSVFVGAIIIAPQLIFIQSQGSAYKGIYMLNTDAELHYLARMEAAVKGNGIGNPFVIEYRNEVPSGFYSYSEQILAIPARVFPITVPDLNLVYKFLLPALLALLIYSLVFRLTGNKVWSLVASVTTVLGSTALNIGTLLNVLNFNLWYQQFLLFSRPVSPISSLIVLFIYLHVLLTAQRTRNFAWYLLLAILFGASWYLYIYLATFMLVLVASCALLYAFRRDVIAALRHVAVLLVGFLLGIPAVLALYSIPQSPYYYLFVGPIGLVRTHAPYVHIPWLIVTALFALFWYYHRKYQHAPILGALLATCFVVVNQQVLTGVSLHPGHYLTYFSIPIYIIVLCAIGAEFFKEKTLFLRRAVPLAVMAYAIIAGVFIQYSSYVKWVPIAADLQRNAVVLDWLQHNTPPESVVMANRTLSELVPVYTADNVMWETHANSYLMPQERWDFTSDNALAAEDFCSFIRQYRLDYVVWDTETDPSWNLDKKNCLRPVAEMEGFTIYAHQ